jgi:hypothetical protein
MANTINLSENLKKLQEIADWFDAQENVDIEAGLAKVKESVTLIKECRVRLADVQNQFNEVKKEIESTDSVTEEAVEEEEKPEEDDDKKIPF